MKDLIYLFLVIAGYLALMKWVLPRFGFHT
jgi:hypothetical protein